MADERMVEREEGSVVVVKVISSVSSVDFFFSVIDTFSSRKNKDGDMTECTGRLAVKMDKRS